jgi:catechol 2,3-dioxygenase-like lactoylglutathione lyase family enzyme
VLEFSQLVSFVASADLARARRFYESVLGLQVERATPAQCVLRAGGTIVRVLQVDEVEPSPHPVLGWNITNIEDAVRTLATHGVTFERYDGLEQDAAGVWQAPDGSRSAWFRDPDGNVLALTQT